MSELRLNVVTKEWVIISPDRGKRPSDFLRPPPSRRPLPEHDPNCPFCPGNETKAATEVWRWPPQGPWDTRVVENMYAVVSKRCKSPGSSHMGLKHAVDGYGCHEVVIDTPRHDLPTALLTKQQVKSLLYAYRERYQAARADPKIAHVVIFKNHGPAAGTSLIHPHSQLVATPVVSYQVRDRIRTLEDHYSLYGECVLCRMLSEEIQSGVRILHLTPSFVALIPYAALSRFHLWIFPRRHMRAFGDITDEELGDMATALRTVLRQVYFGLGDPAFNYVIRSAPRGCGSDDFHWYMSLIPRMGSAAGFELGSGMFVNDSYPEESAAFLRSVEVPPDET